MTPILANVKLKWFLLALIVLICCQPAASCGTSHDGKRAALTLSVAKHL